MDPCLLLKRDDKGTVILCICIDDACLFGNLAAVHQAKADISSLFNAKDVGDLKEHVGVAIEKTNDSIGLSQPGIIAHLEWHFAKDVE